MVKYRKYDSHAWIDIYQCHATLHFLPVKMTNSNKSKAQRKQEPKSRKVNYVNPHFLKQNPLKN